MAEEETITPIGETERISRRTMVRRGAVIGGSLVWAAPAIQAVGPAAFAQSQTGSPACTPGVRTFVQGGSCVETIYSESLACCSCIATQEANGADAFLAAINCVFTGDCGFNNAIFTGAC